MKIALGALASLLLLPAAARADFPRKEIFLGGGAFHPTSKLGLRDIPGDEGERFGRTGHLFSIGYYQNLTRVFSLGFEVAHANRAAYKAGEILAGFPGSETRIEGETRLVLALLRVRGPGARWRPYGTAGFGIQQTSMDAFIEAAPGRIWIVNGKGRGSELRFIQGRQTTWAGTVRAGLERVFPDGGSIGLEAGWLRIPRMKFGRTSDGAVIGVPREIQTAGDGITVGLKFGYSFGAKP